MSKFRHDSICKELRWKQELLIAVGRPRRILRWLLASVWAALATYFLVVGYSSALLGFTIWWVFVGAGGLMIVLLVATVRSILKSYDTQLTSADQ
jgi:hypothetical protein